MTRKGKKEIAIGRHLPKRGRWSRICSPWIGNRETSCLRKNAGLRQRKDCRNQQDERNAQTARSCMLPTERRRSHSRGSLRIVSGLAENTNSIFCDGPSRPETANGFLVLPSAGTDAERHTVARRRP